MPYENHALRSMPIRSVSTNISSKLDNSERDKKDKEGFEAQDVRGQSAVGVIEVVKYYISNDY
ncbi:hypothetical protein UXU46_01060 [Campylobacter jejuni]